MSLSSEFSEQAFMIPYLNKVDPSPKGWSIWTFTDLDWYLLSGLPGKSYMRRYYCEELEDGQHLLADCRGYGLELHDEIV
jgi:hypothetical protein